MNGMNYHRNPLPYTVKQTEQKHDNVITLYHPYNFWTGAFAVGVDQAVDHDLEQILKRYSPKETDESASKQTPCGASEADAAENGGDAVDTEGGPRGLRATTQRKRLYK